MGTTVGEIFCCIISSSGSSLVLYISDDVASVLRGFMAGLKKTTEGKSNIVIIKASIDHDASGIKDTVTEEEVCFTLFHNCKIVTSGDSACCARRVQGLRIRQRGFCEQRRRREQKHCR